MDGSASASPAPSSSAPSAPPSSAPSSAPQSTPPPAPSSRGPDGKFSSATSRPQRGELKKRIRAGLDSSSPAVEMRAEPSAEPTEPQAEQQRSKSKAQKTDASAQTAATAQWTEDPSSWAEPAQKAYQGLQEQYRTEIGKWEEVGRKAVEQNRRLLEEVKFLREQVQNAGVQVDPRDLELLNYRSRDASAQQMMELQKQRDAHYQQQRQQQEHAQIRREAQAAVSQMQKLAKSKGIDIRSIYAEYKAASSIGENIGFDEAASRVLERLEWKQRKVNATAPAPTVSGIPAGTTLPKSRTRNGRLDRLRALGHAV